ncbi:hypothetical protein JJC04_10770 [Flavobacterium covae]|nr:cyclic nucleotide-binding domain-containing protein [Flavobacterium covae]QYS90546.1 hypothetical protein JJC04_10770 [Flavobacterium covae]
MPIVKSGVVRLDCASIEKDVLLDYVVAGEACVVSFSHCDIKDKLVFSAQALTEVEAWLIPKNIVNELLEKDQVFVNYLMRRLTFEFQNMLPVVCESTKRGFGKKIREIFR